MTETAVRDLMRQAMAGSEPSMGPVLGEALRAARRARRQRLAGSVAAAAAAVACLVVVLSAVGGPGHSLQRRNLTLVHFVFIRPALPDTMYVAVHPITSEFFGQLLVAELPPSAGYSNVEASANANTPGATSQTASASLSEVTTAIGSGTVQAEMVAAGATDVGFGCPPGLALGLCKAYGLQGGVKVVEEYASTSLSTSHLRLVTFHVQVFRPRVAIVSLSESNRTADGSAVSLGMPLTASQLLTAAVDPRWQFSITRPLPSGLGSGRGMLV